MGQALWARYLAWERDSLVQRLSDWETQIIEKNLPDPERDDCDSADKNDSHLFPAEE